MWIAYCGKVWLSMPRWNHGTLLMHVPHAIQARTQSGGTQSDSFRRRGLRTPCTRTLRSGRSELFSRHWSVGNGQPNGRAGLEPECRVQQHRVQVELWGPNPSHDYP